MKIGYACRQRSIADRTAGDFDGPDFQCFFVDTKRNFALNLLFCAAMLARMLLALALLLDAVAINQEVQWFLRPAIGMFTARVFWRRLRMIVGHTWMAAAL